MQILIRKPTLHLAAGAIVSFLLFAGRWGLNLDPHQQPISDLGDILYRFAFEMRWWLLLALGIVVAADLYQRQSNRFMLRVRHRGTVAFLALIFILLAGAATTEGTPETLAKSVDLVGLAVAVVLIFYCQNQGSGASADLQHATLVCCFLLGTTLSLLALATSDLTQRAAVADGGPNTFVRIVGVAAISCIGLRRIPQPIAFIATAGYLALIVLTQSRGGLLAFSCAVGLQFVWLFGWRSKLVYGGIGLAAIAAIANGTAIGKRCVEIIHDRVFTQTIVNNYTAGRDEIYLDAWHIWQDNFFVGSGLNAWWDQLATYPHNIILELGCDGGLFSVATFMLLIGIYAANAMKCKTQTAKTIACITLFYFLAAQFSGDLYDSRGLFYFGTMLCAGQISRVPRPRSSIARGPVASRRRPHFRGDVGRRPTTFEKDRSHR